jgi:membrane protein DedA with SNARE-associated domain
VVALLNLNHFISTYGYAAIFLLSVLQSCCIPTSSELTLGFAGLLASQGKLNLAAVIFVGTAGEVVGAYIAWFIGRYGGRAAVDRYGKYILLTHHDLDRAEGWYDRHGNVGVFVGRLLPVIRNFVALPAGVAEVPLVRFGLMTAAGSLIWISVWASIGYGLGGSYHKIAKGFGYAGFVLGAAVVVAIVFLIWHRYRAYQAAVARGAATPRNGSPSPAHRAVSDGRNTPPAPSAKGAEQAEPAAPIVPVAEPGDPAG